VKSVKKISGFQGLGKRKGGKNRWNILRFLGQPYYSV
jgi:hypothetical protein